MDQPSASQSKPPLLLLLATQLRADVLGGLARTPHLDVLSRYATVFHRHFTNCPQGMPARASIYSGTEPFRHGVLINGWTRDEMPYATLPPEVPLFQQKLVEAGYRVVHVGIPHLRSDPPLPEKLPGVEFVGPASVGQYHEALRQRGLMLGDLNAMRDPVLDYDNAKPLIFSAASSRVGVFPLREELFLDRLIAQQAAQMISGYVDERPLALLCHFWLAHPPLWAPRKWLEMYDPETIELPPTVGKWLSGSPVNSLANIPGQLGAHVSEQGWRQAWAAYLGMVALLDDCMGQVLRALERRGWFEQAAIVFTADHGEMLGSRGMFQKMCLYDPAVRVPLIVKPPGPGSARQVTELTSHSDLAAAMLQFCDVPTPAGSNLAAMAAGKSSGGGTSGGEVFASYDGNAGRGYQQRMVRSATHKLIWHVTGEWELYDLIEDPHETQNLFGHGSMSAVQHYLQEQLAQWRRSAGDPLL
ncbi:MAG: sulfatase-like hydrolase/transferase [Phycisphaeraceae bacterium]|nr:sulfatase-like hydrolase/transferase [Phycisphaeraceae bacterium]